jgi:hypothetical protein
MTGCETPPAALFHKRISKLNIDVDRFTLGVALYFGFARYDRSLAAVELHLHIVILEDIVMDSAAPRVFDIVGGRADFAFEFVSV